MKYVNGESSWVLTCCDFGSGGGNRVRYVSRQYAELAVDFGLAPAHREVPPDASLRLGMRPVVGGDRAHGALTRRHVSAERGAIPCGIEFVEWLDADAPLVGDRQPLAMPTSTR